MSTLRSLGAVRASLVLSAAACVSACVAAREPVSLAEIASRALPYEHSADKDAVVDGVNAFGLAVYAEASGAERGNLLLSPFSISSALAMTYAGARGSTATEMAAALRITIRQEALPAAYASVLADVRGAGAREGYELDIANSLWGQVGYPFLVEFLTTLDASYGAPLHEVDYIAAAEQARGDINAWVAAQTHNRITEILPAGSVDAYTRLVLANALYFKGTWARAFDRAETTDGPFRLESGAEILVPVMHQEAELAFAENDLVQLVELPYTTGDLSMVVIVPAYGHDLAEVEAALSPSTLASWLAGLAPVAELGVSLPRWTFSSSFSLAGALGALGMPLAFTPAADFSGMTGSQELFLGDVYHETFVLVDEEGTEAAASTAVTVGVTAAGPGFVADRPFLFLIRHNASGLVLFLGRVVDPR